MYSRIAMALGIGICQALGTVLAFSIILYRYRIKALLEIFFARSKKHCCEIASTNNNRYETMDEIVKHARPLLRNERWYVRFIGNL